MLSAFNLIEMFTDKDLKKAIEDGIFSNSNEVTANPSQVIIYFEKWAEQKCKEVAKNVRHKAIDLYHENPEKDIDKLIMNIQYDDVKPNCQ